MSVPFNSSVSITVVSFDSNYAENYGGAIYFDLNTLSVITYCYFTSNEGSFGGGIFFNGGEANIINSNFAINKAQQGAIIYGQSGTGLVMDWCNVTNHTSTQGATLFLDGSLIISNSIFSYNIIDFTFLTGAIHCWGILYITHSIFQNNGGYFGAISVTSRAPPTPTGIYLNYNHY